MRRVCIFMLINILRRQKGDIAFLLQVANIQKNLELPRSTAILNFFNLVLPTATHAKTPTIAYVKQLPSPKKVINKI